MEKNVVNVQLEGGPLNGATIQCSRPGPVQLPVPSCMFKSTCATSQPAVTVLTYAPIGQTKVTATGDVREVYAVRK